MDASGKLQERICSQHRKLQDIFCHTDQQCICLLCIMDIHKNHDTVSAVAERTEKESHLIETQKKYQQRIQEKQKDLQELRDAVVTYKRSAQAAVEDSERIFTELIFLIEISCSEMTQLIRDQEKAEVSQAEEILKRLEQEINDLKKRDAEMEQLLHTDDHIHFLQSFQSLSVPPGSTDSLNITVSSLLSFDEVGKLVSRMREKLENLCTKEIKKTSGRVSNVKIIGPRSRQEFLQHSFQFTMEQKTAYEYLCLSEGNRVIINNAGTLQLCPDHPDKFNVHPQVLCRESVCGRCYWEVEWSGRVDISVSYKSISRKGWGDDCFFGRNNQSWSLYCSDSSCSFWHNNIETELPVVSRSCRIGVYVNHSAGILSFYSVSDTMTLIHRVHITFTQPLYPGFRLDYSAILFILSKVKLCEINKVNISESELY
ncbi:tripartite motif-containing protein 16-like isoform X2 [Triplophysa rosa]|nr:tripartite motif-containing protein 16-like isoform X2 [Triplophysa rosa]